jgi:hypothetical protein
MKVLLLSYLSRLWFGAFITFWGMRPPSKKERWDASFFVGGLFEPFAFLRLPFFVGGLFEPLVFLRVPLFLYEFFLSPLHF